MTILRQNDDGEEIEKEKGGREELSRSFILDFRKSF